MQTKQGSNLKYQQHNQIVHSNLLFINDSIYLYSSFLKKDFTLLMTISVITYAPERNKFIRLSLESKAAIITLSGLIIVIRIRSNLD